MPCLKISGAEIGQWTQDYDAAIALAKEHSSHVMLNFTVRGLPVPPSPPPRFDGKVPKHWHYIIPLRRGAIGVGGAS